MEEGQTIQWRTEKGTRTVWDTKGVTKRRKWKDIQYNV